MNLMGNVPDVSRALEALQAVHDVIDIDDMVKAIRRIGNRNTSVAAQKRAIAMMSEGRYEDDDGTSDGRGNQRRVGAMVAAKKPKIGRCKFHDAGRCKLGSRCRFNHMGGWCYCYSV